jgi:hypothetical protein
MNQPPGNQTKAAFFELIGCQVYKNHNVLDVFLETDLRDVYILLKELSCMSVGS